MKSGLDYNYSTYLLKIYFRQYLKTKKSGRGLFPVKLFFLGNEICIEQGDVSIIHRDFIAGYFFMPFQFRLVYLSVAFTPGKKNGRNLRRRQAGHG